MKNIFTLPPSFTIPLAIIGIGLVWAMVAIVLKNLNSKDVVFSFSALVAASVMFYLNISLGMKDEVKEYDIKTHAFLTNDLVIDLDVDNDKSDFLVTQRGDLSRAVKAELQAFDKKGNPDADLFSEENLDKLEVATRFYYINSILGSMLMAFPDWQGNNVKHRGGTIGSFNAKKEGAGINTFIEPEKLDKAIGNAERGYTLKVPYMMARGLTLPPDTRVHISGGSLVIENPFLLLEVGILLPGSFKGGLPDTNVTLEYFPVIQLKQVMKKERSGSPEYDQYAAWADKLYEHLKRKFE